jgi:hypothetical protein
VSCKSQFKVHIDENLMAKYEEEALMVWKIKS